MIAMPDPSTFAILPYRPRERAVARMFCDIRRARAASRTRATRATCCGGRSTAREAMGFDHFYLGPELEYFYFRSSEGTEVLDRGGYFDLTTLDAASDLRRDTVLALEEMGIAIEYSHHEVGPLPARDRHALRRRAAHGRQRHDLPHDREGDRPQARLLRHLHAEAALRTRTAAGCTRTRASSAATRTPSSTPTTSTCLSADGKAFIAGPAAPRARDRVRLRPVGQLLQAPGAGLRGAGVRGVEPAQPLGAGPRADATTRARSRPRGPSCAAPTPPATRT